MTTSKNSNAENGWVLRRPLQIESLKHKLPESDEVDKLLKQLQFRRENVDAVVYALSSRNLASDRREHLVEILRKHQSALEEAFQELGLPLGGQGRAPLWYFNQLDPIARTHLAAILGVPEEAPYYEVLDIKAEEYLAQHQAFQAITERHGFRDRQNITRNAKRSVLILTLSGSLIQLSEPISSRGERRYLYQNIYGNAHPPEGVLVLDRDVRVGHRLRSVELTTSPIRLLRVAGRRVSWKVQSQTFERLSRTLTSLVSQSNSQLAAAGWPVSPQTGFLRRANLQAAARVLREEYASAFASYEELRSSFRDEEHADPERVEAELLTICHLLQTGARELGFESRQLSEVEEFTTEEDHLYRLEPESPGTVTLYPRGKGPEVLLVDVTVGRQAVTARAPLALIGGDGGLVEITRQVTRIKRK